MEKKLNEKQLAVLEVLKKADGPMTLAEISVAIGSVVKSGTTNTLVDKKYMKIAGERIVVCAACGHKHKVKEYVIGD